MTTKKIGDRGEQQAVQFLTERGYAILERNYRDKRSEVDIIAQTGHLLVFVEVKTRKNALFGYPEQFVDPKKIDLLHRAATAYQEQINWQDDIRFDIIAITDGVLEHFEDSF